MAGATPRIYTKIAESGRKRYQHFCAECGTHIFVSGDETGDLWGLRWGSVIQRADIIPRRQVWCGSALEWAADLRDIPGG